MDSLQGGFQTAPVKLPLTPYQKAVSARESVVQIVQDQIYTNSEKTVCLNLRSFILLLYMIFSIYVRSAYHTAVLFMILFSPSRPVW